MADDYDHYTVEHDERPIYFPNATRNENVLRYLNHVHDLDTGICIKNRFGKRCNLPTNFVDEVEALTPTVGQEQIIVVIVLATSAMLRAWGRQSGRTTCRKMVAAAILKGDDNDDTA